MLTRVTLVTLYAFAFLFAFAACSRYKSQEVAFRHPSAYLNVQQVAGATIGAEAFGDEKAAETAFGFNIIDAGLLPVQVVIDNAGTHSLKIVPEQTFLIDSSGGMWDLLESRMAYERLEKSSEFARVSKSAGESAGIGALGGAIVGAAIGILSGENVGETTLKGAAVGGAGGAVIGGGQELGNREGARQITRDMRRKELGNKQIEAGSLGRGFLFFPAEAKSAVRLRLQVREGDGGKTHTLFFSL